MNVHFAALRQKVKPVTITMDAPIPAQDVRVAEILARARTAFAEKGFDGASMQDLARSAGMSVGNFYRYFPSKAAMVEALITADMAEVQQDFAQILNSPDPMQRLRDTITLRIAMQGTCPDDGRMWAEITAAAFRKPEIAAITARMEAGIVDYLCTVFSRVTGLTQAAALARFQGHARFVVMMIKTAAIEGLDHAPGQDTGLDLLQAAINGALDDVLHQTKGHSDAH
jgi:AcrR family transcriptional regulator